MALSKRPYGRPIAVIPRPWIWFTVLVVTMAVIAAVFLVTAEYSRKESVRGWLVARDGVARITYNAAGLVDSVPVKAGQKVQAGDPIVYLSREKFLQDGRNSSHEIMDELGKQVAAIDRRIELLRTGAAIERDSIQTQLKSLDAQAGVLSRQKTGQQRRLEVASEKLSRLRRSAKMGAATDWEVLNQLDERSLLEYTWAEMQQSDIALNRERKQLHTRAKILSVDVERSIASLLSERSQLQQKITDSEYARRVVLKAPISGKVASVEVHAGGTVLANQLLATVLPEDTAMLAEVYVPSSAIGLIREGQRVRLMYDAFPHQQFGVFAGEVARISDFILMPAEVPQTFFLREATFKVQIAIQRDTVQLKSGTARLRPGMLLAAEIVLETRGLIDWLLWPLRFRQRAYE